MNNEELISKIDEKLARLLGEEEEPEEPDKTEPIPPPSLLSTPVPDASDLLPYADMYNAPLRTRGGPMGYLLAKTRSVLRRIISPFLLKQNEFNARVARSFCDWAWEVATTITGELSAVRTAGEYSRAELNDLRKEVQELRAQIHGHKARLLSDSAVRSRQVLDDFLSKLEGVDPETKARIKSQVERYASPVGIPSGYPGGVSPSLARMRESYLDLIPEGGSVIDLSSGAGEFLEMAKKRGISARGAEKEPVLARECRQKDLQCEEADPADFLGRLRPGEAGMIFCSGLPETLSFDTFREISSQSFAKLDHGGVFVVEGINPFSSSGEELLRGNPRCLRGFNPQSMMALLRAQGFDEVSIEFLDPASQSRAKDDFGAAHYIAVARK